MPREKAQTVCVREVDIRFIYQNKGICARRQHGDRVGLDPATRRRIRVGEEDRARAGGQQRVDWETPVRLPGHGHELHVGEFGQDWVQRIGGVGTGEYVAGAAVGPQGDLQDVVTPVARKDGLLLNAVNARGDGPEVVGHRLRIPAKRVRVYRTNGLENLGLGG